MNSAPPGGSSLSARCTSTSNAPAARVSLGVGDGEGDGDEQDEPEDHTETTTDMTMPTAAPRDALSVSSDRCAESVVAGDRVTAPSRGRCRRTKPETRGFVKFVAPRKPDAFDRLAEDVADRLVMVGDHEEDRHDQTTTPAMLPPGRDRVDQVEDRQGEQVQHEVRGP